MANRIQQKRSSVLGKRPDPAYLEPGEIALNTNATTSGVFFETNDGNIAKAGPAYIGVLPPPSEIPYGNGETWFDEGNGTFKTYKAATQQWLPTLSPLFGGGLTVIFVGTEFPEATDDLSNDGTARPFATLNRAAIEVARRSILPGRSDEPFNSRFVVILLPGENTVVNDPGLDLTDFQTQVAPFSDNQAITVGDLAQFNPLSGGLIFPRGTSIFGFDMVKTEIRPTYYPFWSRELYETSPELITERTAQIKWTGNSFFNNITFRDKSEVASVKSIAGEPDEVATCTSLQPHGYRAVAVDPDGAIISADKVTLIYSDTVSQSYDGEATVREGEFFVNPITPTTFTLLTLTGESILRKQLPEDPDPGSEPAEYFRLTYTNTTHHRLSCVTFATRNELNDYYAKVQLAFANIEFGGRVGNAEVASGEVEIVAPVPSAVTQSTNDSSNAAPYAENVSLRSNFGQCGLTADGALVGGTESANASYLTTVSLQNDADVYEIFYEGEWMALTKAYAVASSQPEVNVSNYDAMQYLDANVPLPNYRFFYRARKNISRNVTTSSGTELKTFSDGLTDEKSDTRHWSVLSDNGANAQVTSSFSVGNAVGYWARGGGRITLTNSQSDFGAQAIRSEGFVGIGTDGGALEPDKGFQVTGIRRPLAVTQAQLLDPGNHRFIYLNQNIAATTETTITFEGPIATQALLPYTLKPGTPIWARSALDGSIHKAFIAAGGLNSERTVLSVESADNTINGQSHLSLPYIRRFRDPRKPEHRSYQLIVGNTSADHRSPTAGKILRLGKSSETGAATPLVAGRQFDPGENGGWNQIFQVQSSITQMDGNNPNHVQGDVQPSQQASGYYLELKLSDNSAPWVGNQEDQEFEDHRYAQGQFCTYEERSFLATNNELQVGANTPAPPTVQSSWTLAMTGEVLQPVTEAYVPADYPNAADLYAGEYPATGGYARGLQCRKDVYKLDNPIDEDDGTANLGLAASLTEPYATSVKVNPPYSNTYWALGRFLRLLGFSSESIQAMTVAQPWSKRNLLISQFPAIEAGAGYALSVAEWPVEFNRGSSVICGDHTWEFAGYLNYTKGLPEYQTSSLSSALRFDAIETSVWGGSASYFGNTELGELVLYGLDIVGGSGQIIPL